MCAIGAIGAVLLEQGDSQSRATARPVLGAIARLEILLNVASDFEKILASLTKLM
jgi:hypothetical protein